MPLELKQLKALLAKKRSGIPGQVDNNIDLSLSGKPKRLQTPIQVDPLLAEEKRKKKYV